MDIIRKDIPSLPQYHFLGQKWYYDGEDHMLYCGYPVVKKKSFIEYGTNFAVGFGRNGYYLLAIQDQVLVDPFPSCWSACFSRVK